MARARNIKPSFFTNEDLGTEDPLVGLLFIGLWCLADRDGRLEDRPLRIKAELFPYRENFNCNGYLTVLERRGFIERYEVDGVSLIQVTNFSKHQSPHNTEKAKGYPPPPNKNTVETRATVNSPLRNGDATEPKRPDSLIPDLLIPDSLIPDCGIMNPDSLNPESVTKNEKPLGSPKAGKKSTTTPAYSDEFEMFWDVYPKVRRENKAEAWKKWQIAIRSVPPAEVIEAAKEYANSPLGSGEFSCMPATFLNKRKWEDDRSSWQRSDQKKTFAQIREENTDAAGERFEQRWKDSLGILEGLQ